MQVKFKEEGEKVDFGGKRETLTAYNLTFEKYQKLMEEFPSLAHKFELIEEKEVVKSKKGE
jgi:hypothetical protein